jgi:carbon-monoxide dehydrogenase medium subunit
VPLVDFFKGPKMTILEPDELLSGLRLPVTAGCSSFHRLGRRRGFTLSVVNAAAYLERYGEKVREARVAFGSVAPTPIRVPKAESELKGKALTDSLIEKVAMDCIELVSPISDVRGTAEYRRDMTAVLAKRALHEAWTRSGGVLK